MRHIIKITLAFSFFVFATISCDDGFEELNVNPTQANEINPGFQFTYIQLQTSGERYENWRAVLIYSSTMMQHLAALPGYWSGDKYLYNAGYASSLWDRAYVNQVRDIEDLYTRLQGDPESINLFSAVRIWRAVIYQRLTDLYGDIPYSEAGKGFIEGLVAPKYDTQEFIYMDMLSEISQAVESFDASRPTFGSADVVFGGDIDKWKKFGNSLMLRLGMRLSKVNPGEAQTWVNRAISGGVMSDLSESAFVPHTDGPSGINNNGIGDVFAADGNQHLSRTFVEWLRERGDPRLEVFSSVPAGTAPVGLPNGYDATTILEEPLANGWVELNADGNVDFDKISDVNPVLVTRSSPMMFQSYAEVEFLLAEAAVRNWGASDAAGHYANGVRAAMKQWGAFYDGSTTIDDAAIDAYLAANPFDDANALEQIGEHFWAATFLNEYEAYANWRRTGFPQLVPVQYDAALPITGGKIPRRLVYPQSEAGVNNDNLSAALSNQGLPSDFAQMLNFPVWWDAQ
ncbi:MAG: SusD/RagB family nutrient-binding outer membrane lipoprotein [Saprospiraceae bacterium]|nr:SusD/RagB family nutrient-binding outer membrane lipoprotein [Saprospiraceae bacterium]